MKNKKIGALVGAAAVAALLAGCGMAEEEPVCLYGPEPDPGSEITNGSDIEEVPDGEYDPSEDTPDLYGPMPEEEEDTATGEEDGDSLE